jgi:hypothetical protein
MPGIRTFVLMLLVTATATAQNVAVTGTVRDAETHEPISGATVRVLNSSRGTYASRNGVFRLPLAPGSYRIAVSSLGYESDTLSVATSSPHVDVALRASPIEGAEVSVTAQLSADEVVRAAILRKAENLSKLRTLDGLLYSKMSLDIAGNAFGQIGDEDRATILETFSRYYYDREQSPPFRINVVNRRQTANIPSQGNLFALGNFVSFYEDEIPLLNARVMTPLAEDAFSRYRFEFAGRSRLAGQTVYLIKVIPTTRVLPAFQGTMKIVKGTYNLVEVDLEPTPTTAIAFVRDLHFVQRFERFAGDVWYPTYLEITGDATVEIVKGLAEIDATVRATSILSDATVNVPLPDSIFATAAEGRRSFITAAPDADSARSEFWENNALSELSDEERQTYAHVDSLVAEADTTGARDERFFRFAPRPNVDFNRVGGVSLFAGVDVSGGDLLDVGLTGGYSFAMKRWLGEANVAVTLLDLDDVSLALTGSLFSRLGSGPWDRSLPRIVNTVTAGLLHRDYYDWFQQHGWSAGVRGELAGVELAASYEESRQYSERNHVFRSLIVREPFRINPSIDAGSYRVASASLGYGRIEDAIVISSGASSTLGVRLTGLAGSERSSGRTFEGIEGRALVELPTFATGYLPMSLRVAAHAGIGSDSMPSQYLFRMRTGASIIAPFGHFMSAPIGHYAGTRYIAVHAEHNFGDILWRWVGLPTYRGRGLELVVGGSSGRWWDEPSMRMKPVSGRYIGTGDQWYSEVGFGFARIPTFISNVAFLRLDARFGIGPLASGDWGLGVSLSSPF